MCSAASAWSLRKRPELAAATASEGRRRPQLRRSRRLHESQSRQGVSFNENDTSPAHVKEKETPKMSLTYTLLKTGKNKSHKSFEKAVCKQHTIVCHFLKPAIF